MKYRSTRGLISGASFQDALFSGYLSDKGLYIPHEIPVLSGDDILRFKDLSYAQTAFKVLRLFICENEIPSEDLKGIIEAATKKFSTYPDVMKVVHLCDQLYVAELFHGPSLSFKDIGLSVIGEMLKYFLDKEKRHVNILVGTSGDTGSAAIESVRGLKNVNIFVLYPKGLCTDLQEMQMATVADENVHCFAVEGTSDDLDVPIKECFTDPAFVREHGLISLNSINWARILVQMVHYIYLCSKFNGTVEFVVPTGALGHVVSGHLASRMGFPIKLVSSLNQNDILYRTVLCGDFSEREVQHTFASAMDIQVPYNVERLLYYVLDCDPRSVAHIMFTYETKRKSLLSERLTKKIQDVLQVSKTTNEEIIDTMQRTWKMFNYSICPQTATALFYHFNGGSAKDTGPRVILATASPAKFPEASKCAEVPVLKDEKLQEIFNKEKKYQDMKRGTEWTNQLKEAICKASLRECN